MKSKIDGFSLIEIMITLVIIGIISAIAIPAYVSSVNRANRTDAIADLNDTAQRLQRCFTTFGRYNPPAGCTIYQQLTGAGVDTRKKFYNITLFNDGDAANDSFTFELRARAVAGKIQARDKRCQILSLNQAGIRASLDDSNAVSTDECWR